MKSMTITEFTTPNTPELIAFRTYWQNIKYPTLNYEDRNFYDYSANMWDWADQYELWSKLK
jgi:hypothetical protein